jgi:membrane protein
MPLLSKIGTKITDTTPIKFIIDKSKATSFPGFRGIPLYDVIQFFISQVKTVGMTERASAIAFNFVMAIPPALIFLFTLLPFIPITAQFENQLYGLIRTLSRGKDNAVLISF